MKNNKLTRDNALNIMHQIEEFIDNLVEDDDKAVINQNIVYRTIIKENKEQTIGYVQISCGIAFQNNVIIPDVPPEKVKEGDK
jgi:hypothetical protein